MNKTWMLLAGAGLLCVGGLSLLAARMTAQEAIAIEPCLAPFTYDASAKSLAKAFGEQNVLLDTKGIEEAPRTKIHLPGVEQTIDVWWDDKELTKLDLVVIERMGSLATMTPRSGITVGGIEFGTSLKNVQAKNGRPFVLVNTNVGSFVTTWKGGTLDKGNCTTYVFFRSLKDPFHPMSTARTMMSDDPSLKDAELIVTAFKFGPRTSLNSTPR